MKFGSASAIPPSGNDQAGTVTVMSLYGPRGGNTYFAVLDEVQVEYLIRELQSHLDSARRQRENDEALAQLRDDGVRTVWWDLNESMAAPGVAIFDDNIAVDLTGSEAHELNECMKVTTLSMDGEKIVIRPAYRIGKD